MRRDSIIYLRMRTLGTMSPSRNLLTLSPERRTGVVWREGTTKRLKVPYPIPRFTLKPKNLDLPTAWHDLESRFMDQFFGGVMARGLGFRV